MRYVLCTLFTLFLFVLFSKETFAQVVINEVNPNGTGSSELDEFIELYNMGSTPEVITGWTLSDTTGSIKTYTIPEKTLNSEEFVSYRRSATDITLNNDGDGIILKDNGGEIKDQISFVSYSNKENRSLSRIPNGSGNFVDDTELSEGLPNIAPPTPTPSPTSTPTSTPSPTPTSTPTPTLTPKPTATPVKTIMPTLIAVFTTPNPTNESKVLAAREELKPTPTPVVSAEKVESTKKFPVVAGVLIVAGIVFVSLAASPFIRMRLKGYNEKHGSGRVEEEIS